MYKIKDIEDKVLALNDPKLTRGINAIKLLSNDYADDDPDAKKADGLLLMTIKEKHPEILAAKKEPVAQPKKKVIKVKKKSPPKPAEKKQEPISKDDSTMTGSQVAREMAKIDHKITQAQHSGIGALKNLYDKWEDENNHSENYLLLARTVGSADDIQWADTMLKKHYELGFLPSGSGEERDAMNKKLWPKWLEHIGGKKAPAASAGKKKATIKIKPKISKPHVQESTKPISLDECKDALKAAHFTVSEKKKGTKKIKIGKKRPDRNIITDKVNNVFKTVGNNLSEKEDAAIIETKIKIENSLTRIFQALDKLMLSKDLKTLVKLANFFESLAEGKKATPVKFAEGGKPTTVKFAIFDSSANNREMYIDAYCDTRTSDTIYENPDRLFNSEQEALDAISEWYDDANWASVVEIDVSGNYGSGGRPKSGLMRDRKYFNKGQGHEVRYNKKHGPRKQYGS